MLFIQSWLKKNWGTHKSVTYVIQKSKYVECFRDFLVVWLFYSVNKSLSFSLWNVILSPLFFFLFSLSFDCISPLLYYCMVSILLSLPPFSPAFLCWLHSITAARLIVLKDYFFTSLGFLILSIASYDLKYQMRILNFGIHYWYHIWHIYLHFYDSLTWSL